MKENENFELVSVIVPIYNVEQYLNKCVKSILSQTYKNLELILIDDGSTDNCGMLCDNYKKKDSRIIVIHKRNGGLISAWKKGLEYATGNLIVFVDSDDWIDTTLIECLYTEYKRTNADIVCCSYYHEFSNSSIPDHHSIPDGVYHKNEIITDIFPKLINDGTPLGRGIRISRWGKILKKDLLTKNIHWVDDRITIGEDLNIMFPVIVEANCISVLNSEYLYHYRANENSMMKKVSNKMFEKAALLYEKEAEIAKCYQEKYDFFYQIQKDFCDLSLNIFMKEYKQSGTFNNYYVARRSEYYLKLKSAMEPKRYSGNKKLLAIAVKSNKLVSTIVVAFMKAMFFINRK
ncbi:glycosyltransferase family 2 protein [Blautia sp. CLA-JM-H16]|uniref:Glycosyltransferase family 2 protein n=1 Tax=Blautia aquisgranensis TaxID=3133153 RepID=A0ABV1BM71_9FIRM